MQEQENQVLLLFGASGDLTSRKLAPALFQLQRQGMLSGGFAVLGVGRTSHTDESFREKVRASLAEEEPALTRAPAEMDAFLRCLHYLAMDPQDAAGYEGLRERLAELDARISAGGRVIYYLATPPALYAPIAENLGARGMSRPSSAGGWKRLIVEKPFGIDLDSARELNRRLLVHFDEQQIYRIDHYLGKETVQNLLVTRFSNGMFEPLWNRNYIHHVEITSAESVGIENRGGYYDKAGALRDMVQNHLMQVCGLVAMEPPSSLDANAVRNETLKVFQALRPFRPADVVRHAIRGQYTASTVRGKRLAAYREEAGIASASRTETYAALKCYIDNWRWGGVPFYFRTGKRLPTRVMEIVIHFDPTPHALFRRDDTADACNQLVIRIQPDEGLLLKFGLKLPGAGFEVRNVNMDFHYSDLADVRLPSAYERLLLDCMTGDSTLYARGDAVEAAWAFLAPVLDAWAHDSSIPVHGYPAGTWGPEHADDLVEGAGFTWRYPCKNLSGDGGYCEL